VEAQAQRWSKQCEEPLAQIYRTPVSERETVIRQWLGINCDETLSKQLGAFPFELSEPFISEYRSYWGKQLRKTQGAAISSLPVESPNVNQIAEVAYNYFRENPQNLTEEQEDTSKQLATSFSEWVLEQYPRLTNMDREIIPINLRTHWLVSQLIKQRRVLWVVVDGLNFINNRRLLELLAQTETESANLAVIPAVTNMAKWALVTGQFPSENSEQNWDIRRAFLKTFEGSVYVGSENIARLKEQLNSKNNLFFWNVMTLDNHYHSQTDPSAIVHQVESDLSSLAKNISDVVMEVPDRNELAVLLSSDHGQLLGPSPPIASELANTKAHGRLAYDALFRAQDLAEKSYRKVEV